MLFHLDSVQLHYSINDTVTDTTTTILVHDALPRTHRSVYILPPQQDKFDIDEKMELLALNQHSFEVNIQSLMIPDIWWVERG